MALALGSPMLIAPFGGWGDEHAWLSGGTPGLRFVRSWHGRLAELDWEKVNSLLHEMESEGEQVLSESGAASQSITAQADMRYVGQGHEVRVDLPTATWAQPTQPPFRLSLKRPIVNSMGALARPCRLR